MFRNLLGGRGGSEGCPVPKGLQESLQSFWGDSLPAAAASEKYDEAYVGRRQKGTVSEALFC